MKMKKIIYYVTLAALVLTACNELQKPTEERVPVALAYRTVQAVETKASQNLNEGSFTRGESIKVRIDIAACYPATAGTSFSVLDDQTDDANYKASDLMFASVTGQAKQAAPVNLLAVGASCIYP